MPTPVLMLTPGDIAGVIFLALAAALLLFAWLVHFAQVAARRVRSFFRNLWSRLHG